MTKFLFKKTPAKTLLNAAHVSAKVVAACELAKTPQQLHQDKIAHALREVERCADARDRANAAVRAWLPGPLAPQKQILLDAARQAKCAFDRASMAHCALLNKTNL